MKKVLAILGLSMALLAPLGGAVAQDAGVPDTLYVEVFPQDQYVEDPCPWFVRFPIYVTHDIVDPEVDSIAGFVIPLCYEVQEFGPVYYCSLSHWWNTAECLPHNQSVQENRSIFRHLPSVQDPQIHNRMLDMNVDWLSGWDYIFLDLGDGVSQFCLAMVPTGSPDQKWWEGSRVLLATMTFKVCFSDSMRLHIDSCFWPPSDRLAFSNSLAETYIPQHFLPVCQPLGYGGIYPPYFPVCPYDEIRYYQGTFTADFTAASVDAMIVDVDADFVGDGITDIQVVFTSSIPASVVNGYVQYTVADRCQSGGWITLTAWDDTYWSGECEFGIMIYNDPPYFSLPYDILAVAGNIRRLLVSATDMENDPVSIGLDALWYEPDSLRPPTNTPSYDGGNPGIFSWLPVEGEEGPWICSFSATDTCGAVTTEEVTITVGPLFCGDNNPDDVLDLGDVVYLLNYLFVGGPPPSPLCKGDANCDGVVDLGDLVRLLNYLFKYGSAPCFECCAR